MTDADTPENTPEKAPARDRDAELVGSTKRTLNKAVLILARGHARRSIARAQRPPGGRWLVILAVGAGMFGHPIVSVILRGG
ncbi:hypothetical protein GCM10009844_22720 [Nocardioides koreensis]|uniref:DUF3040 domain-containing protein n=1 Tax=Nocardioides koreensis TaxID=433651 RepID=A0ABP5LIQ0_9ACTN